MASWESVTVEYHHCFVSLVTKKSTVTAADVVGKVDTFAITRGSVAGNVANVI